nr:cytochrome c [Nitrosomonas nitrosa]
MALRIFVIAVILALHAGAGQAADGQALYQTTCIACHGPKAEGAIPGVPNLGEAGRLDKDDSILIANIINGFQSKGSPMAMPPKGANPSLTEDDAKMVIEYLRQLTAKAK